jgi:hypothetical protein
MLETSLITIPGSLITNIYSKFRFYAVVVVKRGGLLARGYFYSLSSLRKALAAGLKSDLPCCVISKSDLPSHPLH